MTMKKLLSVLAALGPLGHALPLDSLEQKADKYIFAALGDSWGSGVQWSSGTQYDGNKDKCMRYKYAWSTVVKDGAKDWVPEDKEAELEFVACSGSHLDDMMPQMDKVTRPKVVLMEAGGNNADFYPLADSCLFHYNKDSGDDYGPNYEKDDRDNPKGECRKEIKLVRERIEGSKIKDQVVKNIHAWRGHSAVTGNDARLFLIGYGRFFALGKECDDWTFNYKKRSNEQKLKSEMRDEINKLTDEMNRGIREAVEEFNDPRIQYINVDPAFEGHRFCEPGAWRWDQYNWNDNVRIWNYPAKWIVTLHKDGKTEEFDMGAEPPKMPPDEDVKHLLNHEDEFKEDDEYWIKTFTDPDDSNYKMELKQKKDEFKAFDANALNGWASRTLHPTQTGHKEMGKIIIEHLKKHVKDQAETPPSEPTPEPQPTKQPQTPPPSNSPTKALSVILEYYIPPDMPPNTLNWVFYETKVGSSAVCGANDAKEIKDVDRSEKDIDGDLDNPPWPAGTYKMEVYGEKCEFKCDGNNAGSLFCPSFEKGIGCKEDGGKNGGKGASKICSSNFEGISHHPVAFCEW